MRDNIFILALLVMFLPLFSSIIVGIGNHLIKKSIAHSFAIAMVFVSFVCAIFLFYYVNQISHIDTTDTSLYKSILEYNIYNFFTINNVDCFFGLLIDPLTCIMALVVTSISMLVHVYTIGYMRYEDGYQRFFSYISLFTFMMLFLIMSNNLIQLFFGWEGVGFVSYLLIGFYYKKESAIFANLKAFLINRIGDIGLILGLALIFYYFETFNYLELFSKINQIKIDQYSNDIYSIINNNFRDNHTISLGAITAICILLFVGAMGKSAQAPLHVWLPDSMEGPTPISALIHAATMVTAGVFMIARLSPLYNLSLTALNLIVIIGAINCLFLGILGVFQNDIKRVVAYSTLSQLGYMMVAAGSGAYSIAIFHLVTHAFFKALLFLCAGSVIVAMHHEQDMTHMGGLRRIMPITYITFIVGTLALVGIPPFSGFFSKDMILEVAKIIKTHGVFGADFVIFAVYASIFITALYSFRLMFMAFHGIAQNKHNNHQVSDHDHHHSTPNDKLINIINLPLIILAIPSALVGYIFFNDFIEGSIFANSIVNFSWYNEILLNKELLDKHHLMLHSLTSTPLYLAIFAFLFALFLHKRNLFLNYSPINNFLSKSKTVRFTSILIKNKYYMDHIYINIIMPFGKNLAWFLYKRVDISIIDNIMVNGVASLVRIASNKLKKIQRGYVNEYAIIMLIALIMLIFYEPNFQLVHADNLTNNTLHDNIDKYSATDKNKNLKLQLQFDAAKLTKMYKKIMCSDFGDFECISMYNRLSNKNVHDILIPFEKIEQKFIDLNIKNVNVYSMYYDAPSIEYLQVTQDESIDYENKTVKLSGRVIMPDEIDVDKFKGVVVYFHPTAIASNSVQSFDIDAANDNIILASVYALQGYIVLVPDYYGLGINNHSIHPYVIYPKINCHAALAMLIDFIPPINKNKTITKLFTVGYSEGAGYSIWFSRMVQNSQIFKNNLNKYGYQLIAASGISGAYDVSGTTKNFLIDDISLHHNNKYNILHQEITNSIKPTLTAAAIDSYNYMSAINEKNTKSMNLQSYYKNNILYFNSSFYHMDCDFEINFLLSIMGINYNKCMIHNKKMNLAELMRYKDAKNDREVATPILFSAFEKQNAQYKYLGPLEIEYSSKNSICSLVNCDGLLSSNTFMKHMRQADMTAWTTSIPIHFISLQHDSVVSTLNSNYAFKNTKPISQDVQVTYDILSNHYLFFKSNSFLFSKKTEIDHVHLSTMSYLDKMAANYFDSYSD